jgi:photosystem II stability/assembly factor-like uncharacterized protein
MSTPRSESRSCPAVLSVLLAGLAGLLGTAFFCGLGAAQSAPQIGPNLYSGLKWRLIGPFRGGRSVAAAGVPSEPDTYYFGAVGGGVWKTINSGRTWQPIFDHEPVSSIGAIAVAPSDPNVIYVGTGETDIRSDLSFGNGMYKSVDAGNSWQHIGLDDTRSIASILVNPRDANVLLVAALGHPYGPNSERGVFRSADGGHSWTKVLYKDENTGAAALSADPETGRTVYASLWQARRPPWSVYGPIEGPGSGLYRSDDGGVTWKELRGNGLPNDGLRRIGISVAYGDQGRRVFGLMDAVKTDERGLYRSDDSGASWKHVSADPRITGRAWYFSGVSVDPQNPETVYVANTAVYRSTDGGASFVPFKGAPGGDDYHSLWLNPGNSKRMVLSSDQGTVVTVDGGETWSSWYNQPTAQFYHVVADDQFPYHVYGAQQDSGSIDIATRSDSPEITFRDWRGTAGGEAGYMAPDPLHPDIVIGGDTYGGIDRLWKTTGQVQSISPVIGRTPNFGPQSGCQPGAGFRFTWTSPIVFSPKEPQALYFSSQLIWRSRDDGTNWQAASPDLTRPAAGPQPPVEGGPAEFQKVTGCGVVYTVAPSPLDAGLLWAGTDDGLVWITRDGGKNWINVTPPALGAWSKVSLIDASHFDAGTAYAAIDRHRLDDPQPHVLRTHDYGRTWQEVDAGLPAGGYVRAVREDPGRQGLLYAGSEVGVSVSFDDGGHWQSLQLNLSPSPIHDLAVHGDDLIVATHGRSFWVLDDITALRQLSAGVAASDAYLFKPAVAMRLRLRSFEGTPLPPDEATAENPPTGAVIDYLLKTETAGDVRLEILDAQGKPVRQYSTADKPPAPQRAPIVTNNWLRQAPILSKNLGLNRFVWDLRFGLAPVPVPGGSDFVTPHGLLVLPGDYQVRLTVNGRGYVQPLKVELDPRVKTPREDIERQFTFQQQVIGSLSNARSLNTALQDLSSKLTATRDSLKNKPETGDVTSAIKALEDKLGPLLGAPGAGPSRSPTPSELLNVPGIVRTLAQALAASDEADAAPTQACIAAAHKAQQDLAAARQQWGVIQKQDVEKLNGLLKERHLEPVDVLDEL